jgi:hypothetical protein
LRLGKNIHEEKEVTLGKRGNLDEEDGENSDGLDAILNAEDEDDLEGLEDDLDGDDDEISEEKMELITA